jgi:tetratricopeptide (TPR) repeat protein
MLGFIIVVGALIGLAAIYYSRLEDTKKRERLKVTIETVEPQNIGKTKKDPNSWKKKNLDYKAINEAYNKADVLYAKNELDGAQKAFIQVLALHPDHVDSNNKLGLIYLKKNMPNKAETAFKYLVDLDSRNPVFYSNLALAYYNQRKLIEAKSSYEKAINLDPRKVSRYISLGQVCVDMKDWKAAIRAYSKAVELNPKEIEFYFIVTDLLVKVSAFNEGIAVMEALLEMHPYNDKAKERIREIKILQGASPLSQKGKGIEKPIKKKNQQSLF